MKDWWLNLSFREKQATLIGGAAVAIFLVYAIIWSPLSNKVSSLREKITHNQSLLSFMQESDRRIQAAENNNQPTHTTNLSILNLIQTDINNSPLAKGVEQLQEIENNTVQLKLQKVGFDSLIKWLTNLCRQERLTISQMSVTASSDPGIVSVDLRIQPETKNPS